MRRNRRRRQIVTQPHCRNVGSRLNLHLTEKAPQAREPQEKGLATKRSELLSEKPIVPNRCGLSPPGHTGPRTVSGPGY
jgi:hypothetical protein